MIKVARACVSKEELDEIKEALDYGYFGLAYKVNELEEQIAKYLGTERNVVCCANGTSALHLALESAGVGPGDEVIVPSFTFIATAQAVLMCGAKVVLCEINKDDFLIDIEDVKRKITKKTKAIIPVHYSGNVCDMDALLELKEKYGIRIIEDAAHAFGSCYKGKKVGTFGDITCFSFDSIKVMTCGEGGAVVTNDSDVCELAKQKRLLGIDRKTMHVKDWKKRSWMYDVGTPGYRYHMSNINAAIGLAQIKKVDKFIEIRKHICELYLEELIGTKNVSFEKADWSVASPFMFPILVENGKRDGLRDYLKEFDVETGISYIPLHRFDLFKDDISKYPSTEDVFSKIVCLPIHPNLTDEDIRFVCAKIKDYLND
ncbi:MAG: DegT/DnrJ/EryC1/StrS family aminotransferase [Bacilli bacterium]|nr:DegT/DnrJ/EryC1/StrS family aminotransferase [Bacilli bacterium]